MKTLAIISTSLLSSKGKVSLKNFTKLYVIVYTNQLTVKIRFTKPKRTIQWEIKNIDTKIELLVVSYENKAERISYSGFNETKLNKTHMLLLDTIFRWVN